MKPTPEQEYAITTPKSLAVIASAGTGKTSVLTQRFVHCLENRGAQLGEILAFTFTEKASREMKERLMQTGIVPLDNLAALQISTIHSFCQKILIRHGDFLNLTSRFNLFDEDGFVLWRNNKTECWLRNHVQNKTPYILALIQNYGFSAVKNLVLTLLNQDDLTEQSFSQEEHPFIEINFLSEFLQDTISLQNSLLQDRILDQRITYDDLERLTLTLLEKNPDKLSEIHNRYKFILLDEAQDISPRQFSLIKKLFNPEKNELFLVGDPKQSIYGFRDASSDLFFKATQLLENHGGETVYLTQTFRTPKKLQNYFNHAFTELLDSNLFQPATSHKELNESGVYVRPLSETKLNKENLHQTDATLIAEQIKKLNQAGVDFKECALLFFSRSSIPLYQEVFHQNQIPFNLNQELRFHDNPLMRAAWHALSYLAGNQNRLHQLGLLRTPYFVIAEQTIASLLKENNQDLFIPLLQKEMTPVSKTPSLDRLVGYIKRWQKLTQTLTPPELFETIIYDFKLDLTNEENSYLTRFKDLLLTWANQGFNTISSVVTKLKDLDVHNLSLSITSGKPNGVALMTIHGSKGLEFDHVFVVTGSRKPHDLSLIQKHPEKGFILKTPDPDGTKSLKITLKEPEIFSEIKQTNTKLEKEETTRLIYVAFTRAKSNLYLFCDTPSKKLLEASDKGTLNKSELKSFNDWVFYLAHVIPAQNKTAVWPIITNKESKRIMQAENNSNSLDFDSLKKLSPLMSFTVTQLENFKECPKRFQMKHLLGWRPLPEKKLDPKTLLEAQAPSNKLSARRKGILFHEILQNLNNQDFQSTAEVIQQALFNQRLTDPDGTMTSTCQLFLSKLESDPFIRSLLFSNQDTYEELPFSYQTRDFILTGQVDRFLPYKNNKGKKKWLIVDYKTHQLLGEDHLNQLVKRFEFQMKCYALALSEAFQLDEIEALILFTSGPQYKKLSYTANELKNFANELNSLAKEIQEGLTQNTFPLTQDDSQCEGCTYSKSFLCGKNS